MVEFEGEEETIELSGIDEDPVFTDEAAMEAEENDPMPEPKGKRRKASKTDPTNITGRLFAASPDELKAEEVRRENRLTGLLIGPKNVEKLRAFGYDIIKLSDTSLTPSVAHRGMTE